MAGIDPFASLTASILDLLTRDGDMFLTLGTHLFRGLAVILVAWFGIQTALTSAEGQGGIPVSRLASLLLTIAFGFAMITYYRAPPPVPGPELHAAPHRSANLSGPPARSDPGPAAE
jgi:hypothetical protein